MGKTLYVANLDESLSERTLTEMFSVFGAVNSTRIMIDGQPGPPKRFAFVEMENAWEAKAAIGSLNGKEVQGRILKVSEEPPIAGGRN